MASHQHRNTFKKNNAIKEKNVRKINFKDKRRDREDKPGHVNFNVNTKDTKMLKNETKFGKYKKAFIEYDNIKSKRKHERELVHKRKTEINAALEKYKKNKKIKFKKLSAKTKKGQPVMKNRIEMLLEKIQSTAK